MIGKLMSLLSCLAVSTLCFAQSTLILQNPTDAPLGSFAAPSNLQIMSDASTGSAIFERSPTFAERCRSHRAEEQPGDFRGAAQCVGFAAGDARGAIESLASDLCQSNRGRCA